MTTSIELLQDGFARIGETLHAALDGLDPDTLATQLEPGTNTIAWLAWHLARVQDDHVAGVAGTEQVWTSKGYHDQFGLPFDASALGYGFSAEEMGQVRGVSAEQLAAYYDDVYAATKDYLGTLADVDLDRVV